VRAMLAAVLCLALSRAASAATVAERGDYIVNRVGMCSDCHTPRDAHGALIRSQWLHGAHLDLRPLHPMPFASYAPSIAGLPKDFTPAQAAHFLETGALPNGSTARPPMPPYRLTPEDAQAVVEYLRTLR
jgi:mono/diheme cytochrome c family protein